MSVPEPVASAPSQAGPAAPARRTLVLETWFVQLAFLLPSVAVAVDMFATHLRGRSGVDPFPTVMPGHPLENLILGGLSYLTVGAVVPLALLLLSRSGDSPASLGLVRFSFREDLLPGLGIAGASYGTLTIMSVLFGALLTSSGLVNPVSALRVPGYYILYGVLVSAVTAVTEETLVNGYLLTRLRQLGWSPNKALALSLCLRTSYHVYYGLGFVFTIPFGYYATRSFAKHGRLSRPIAAHFIYDLSVFTISMALVRPR